METKTKREEFVAELKVQLDKWNQKIDRLEERARKEKDEAAVQADLGMAELRKRRDELRKKLDEVEDASRDAWVDLRHGAERALNELVAAFTKARSRYDD